MQRIQQPRRKSRNTATRQRPEPGTGEDLTDRVGESSSIDTVDSSPSATVSRQPQLPNQTEVDDFLSQPEATTPSLTGRTWPDIAHEWVPKVLNIKVALGVVPFAVFLLAVGTGNLKSLPELGSLVLVAVFLDIVIWLLSRSS